MNIRLSFGSKFMLVLISYDVNTEDAKGRSRLRKVARECENYGQRVQNSVFECLLDAAQLCVVKDKILKIIDTSKDNLRIYCLGNNYKEKVESFGKKPDFAQDAPMII